ncbi:MAG: ATP-binding cassette domain-containing protein [Pseudomonadales bacterium]
MSRIAIKNLWKQYGTNIVLENLNLTIEDQEFVSIVGASGCGKTTFLRLLLGEERPSRGVIEIDDVALQPEPSVDRGVVFQRYSVFPHLTVLKNVLLALELREAKLLCRTFGNTRKKHIARCKELLQRVGLGSALDQYPSALSGGMQQRLALCQALIAAPKILLLDEPFGALDPGIRKDMQALVAELHSELQLTVIMITHDLSEGFELGTRLLVFDKTRNDPHEPELFGAGITYDLPLTTPLPDSLTLDVALETDDQTANFDAMRSFAEAH